MIDKIPQLAAPDLKRRLDTGERLTLLDVREDEERALCAIPLPPTATNLHVPMNQVPARLDILRKALAAGPVVVYCHHGIRSMVVARWLAAQGMAGIHNLDGGIDAYSLEVEPALPRY